MIRIILYITTLLAYLFVLGLINTLFGTKIYELLFLSQFGSYFLDMFSGLSFYAPLLLIGLVNLIINLVISIIIAAIFYPRKMFKYTAISFVLLYSVGYVFSIFGISQQFSYETQQIVQKNEFQIISEKYASKNLGDGTISPNLVLEVNITNADKEIISGRINTFATHPYISLFSCDVEPEYVNLEPNSSIDVALDCYLSGNANTEQKRDIMKEIPKELEFALNIVPENSMVQKSYLFKTQEHNWENF